MRLAYQMRFVPLGVLSGSSTRWLLIFQAQLPELGINLHFGETQAAGHGHAVILSGVQLPII